MDRFTALLTDFSTLIQVPLHPNSKRICCLQINNQFKIHLEDQESQDRILIACCVAELLPGKYRELVLRETLKENNTYPRIISFGLASRNNMLSIFAYLNYKGLDGNTLADFIEKFIELTISWKTSIDTGQLPQRGKLVKKSGPSVCDVRSV